MTDKTLIVVAGPTAAGKTAAAIKLAQHFNTSIISADSRQFYKEMSIGTAKPDGGELAAAQHLFINSHAVTDNFNVGDFETKGLKAIETIFATNDIAIMVGGSGLYIKAICDGFDNLPPAKPGVRQRINEQFQHQGILYLQERLKEVDPVYYAAVDVHNPQRLIRALEIFESTGNPFSSFRTAAKKKRPFNILKIGLTMPRQELYSQINDRVDKMIAGGLVNEVKSLIPYRHLNALKTVGYKEIFTYLDGDTDLPAAIASIKQHTRQFAKRQLTWFNRDADMHWINPLQDDIVIAATNLLK